ncbi:MAG: alpha/beta hydrolase, partial [Succinivibrio sp.]
PSRTVDVLNALAAARIRGEEVFYRFYSSAEIKADPAKAGTGLFFFRGRRNARTAVCVAGGGFQYVGAIHDSFPHARALSQMGYNAFALIYRPGAYSSCEDLSRALAFLHKNAKPLGISMDAYLLEGGSAGARTADWVGSYGTESFGAPALPRPAALALQYTGLDEVTGDEPPTYMCVGNSDWIASAKGMAQRAGCLRRHGIDSEIEVFDGLGHGFGLGEGTTAEGWIKNAAAFWERHADKGQTT